MTVNTASASKLQSILTRQGPKVYVIAEVGINHNGDLQEAKNLIKAAAEAGANGIKVQVRDLEEIYSAAVIKDPRLAEQGTQYILSELKKAHLDYDQIRELAEYTRQFKVDFFGTPFDLKSADFLDSLGVELFKIGSPDFTNLLLLERVASFKKPIILSTGMCTEQEIKQVSGYLKKRDVDFALLHCNSTYPASYIDINLRYIPVLKALTGVPVGYSGHEQGWAPTFASLGLGAEIIERHITRDRSQSGPDHSASLTFEEFKAMVDGIRTIEISLGLPEKGFCQGEKINRLTLGKSIVAAHDLKAGTRLTVDRLNTKSPAKGTSPLELEGFLGGTLTRDIPKDGYVFPEDLAGHQDAVKSSFSIPKKWGVVGRLNDFQEFLDLRPTLMEIHLTWRDLVGFSGSHSGTYTQDLIVHAPEYFQDQLIDFTSDDPKIVEMSVEMLNRAIALTRALAPHFKGATDPRGPRLVLHPGGHFRTLQKTDKQEQYRRLVKNLKGVDTQGVRVLVENMPPFPWYFGGQWHQSVFMDSKEIAEVAKTLGWGVCYDTSHALLYCNSIHQPIEEFSKNILPHVHYLHVSDAKGVTEEGLQLGQGNLSLPHAMELIHRLDVGFIPEIWQGHLNSGRGFKVALTMVEKMLAEKVGGASCQLQHVHGPACG